MRGLIERLKRFRRETRAVAAVEFALILPFLLLLYVGSIEASQLIIVDRRVTTVAGTVGDLVARADGSITQAQLTDYFRASQGIFMPFSTTGLRQVITCVYVAANGTTQVRWSRGYNGGVAKTAGQTFALPTEVTTLSRNSYIIVSETSYSYRPMLGIVFPTAIPLYRENFHSPRFGDFIDLKS